MKVQDLIKILTECDPDSMVTMANYDGGFDELNEAQLITLVLNVHTHQDFGAHERIEVLDAVERKNSKQVRAICLGKLEPSRVYTTLKLVRRES